ncbi:MAG: hypothetical protein P4L63_01255 [Candidatus Pacebacteria bacterium]|nr:hypothetical protein [Candidatus Paceibacterota bacterium]
MSANRKQSQQGFVPVFIIAIIVVLLGGFTIYNLEKNNTGITVQNQTAASIQSTGNTLSVKNNTQTKPAVTTAKAMTTKTKVYKKARHTTASDDRDDDD